MKRSPIGLVPLLLLIMVIMACKMDDTQTPAPVIMEEDSPEVNSDTTGNKLRIRVGSRTFQATLLNNPTVTAFKARLPLTITMSDLNANEKLYNFPQNLPTNSANPGTIQTGDLMLYGSNTLVLFYKSFSTIYSYTKLGRIDNPSGLATALGSGNITVTYALE
jgi:hypothetical protein